jgi:hypothetical protein
MSEAKTEVESTSEGASAGFDPVELALAFCGASHRQRPRFNYKANFERSGHGS